MLIIDDLITLSCMIYDEQNFPARNFVTSIIFSPNNVAGEDDFHGSELSSREKMMTLTIRRRAL